MKQKKQWEPENQAVSDELSDLIRDCHLVVTSFGRSNGPREEKRCEFTIGDCELIYITKGQMQFSDGMEHTLCQAGSLLFLCPLTEYQVDFSQSPQLEYYYLHFDITPIHQLESLRSYLFGEGGPVFHPPAELDIGSRLEVLHRAMKEKHVGYYAMTVAELICLLVILCRSRKGEEKLGDGKGPAPREMQIVNEAIGYIDSHMDRPLRVTEISKYVGVSENYLYKSFVNVVKLPPSKYILRHKVKQAEKYLKTGQYTMYDISQLLGFSSLFHFSKTFKDYFGVSPKQYMKINRLK